MSLLQKDVNNDALISLSQVFQNTTTRILKHKMNGRTSTFSPSPDYNIVSFMLRGTRERNTCVYLGKQIISAQVSIHHYTTYTDMIFLQ